jgi:hypothetical protein
VGSDGDLVYAIQGNVLTGIEVVLAAEAAVLSTEGDVSQKLVAAMLAARSLGGDGRCSCNGANPTSCGVPPPDFDKSAHIGFIMVARIGDVDGGCAPPDGCANGDYYLNLNQITVPPDTDPVLKLASFYNLWRLDRVGRPDGVLSRVTGSAAAVPADGRTVARFQVRLVDIEGTPLAQGGANVTVATESGGDAHASLGAVVDNGDGSYSFEATAGQTPGLERFVVRADDGFLDATIYPYPELRVDAVTPLHLGFDALQGSLGGSVPIVLNVPQAPGARYWILAGASGTAPGMLVGSIHVPLNRDLLTRRSRLFANSAAFPGTVGRLDAQGRAEAAFVAPPGVLSAHAGQRYDWAAVIFEQPGFATEPQGFEILR